MHWGQCRTIVVPALPTLLLAALALCGCLEAARSQDVSTTTASDVVERIEPETFLTAPYEAGGRSFAESTGDPEQVFPDGDELDLPLRAKLGDGFTLETPDQQYQFRVRALTQVDGKFFTPTDQEPARSGLYIPRFRVYFEGQLTELFEYELSLQRSVEGAFDILDANTNFRINEGLQFKVGRSIAPYSFAWYDHLEQYYITPERGLFALNFGLARQSAVIAHGRLNDDQFQYAIGGTLGQLAGLADTNATRDAVGYFNARPFLHTDSAPWFQFLNLGGSLAVGRQAYEGSALPLRTSLQTSENDEAAQAASSIFLEFNDGVVATGRRIQGSLHASWYAGPFSLEAEWYSARFQLAADPAAEAVTIPISGFDVTLGGFVTGETVEKRGVVVPLRPFTPQSGGGPGAVELFGRYSHLQLSNRVFTAGLADAADWTNRAAITDIGLNWYLNRFVRLTFDWQHGMYADPVLFNEERDLRSRTSDLYWARCQLYF
ncbi:OprO/OprP family phosphate-selective porin [Planctellipticum variicoloris]|uniref:OprO/OprP family phosphate-selective porin n=1 Tax=Planctellipticum variicoloris TaxID=3064265 RepID=UPI003013EA7D|nr:OprO/OprP family phosphate-selective porin [Planctomycetaceae bacterium SH412]